MFCIPSLSKDMRNLFHVKWFLSDALEDTDTVLIAGGHFQSAMAGRQKRPKTFKKPCVQFELLTQCHRN